MKKFSMVLCLTCASASMTHASHHNTADLIQTLIDQQATNHAVRNPVPQNPNNVALGLPPIAGQSVSVLKPFKGDFRILGYKTYQDDEQAKFSPVDFAVSWGMFANPKIASQIHVTQYDRFLKWAIPSLPVPAKEAMQMVSNIHIIPANPEIAQQIKQVKRGDLVRMKGNLVEIKADDLVWRSSLRPDDVGEGACEVFQVESIQWIEQNQGASNRS
ncbi:hypothetical protein SAMN05421749_102279 [Acinetobacter marinus]|uniref:Uncharacterized protein n=1 Tax=Acinetobacter marinus TaxID=281375 RepID=A0A1G6HID2_9GAMM|nr:hypothetical protein SAMN05421749_102279 [Acinetobacter marinus]